MAAGGEVSTGTTVVRPQPARVHQDDDACREPVGGETVPETEAQTGGANACYVDANPVTVAPAAPARVHHALFSSSGSFSAGQTIVHQQTNRQTGAVVATTLIARVEKVDAQGVHVSFSERSPLFPFVSAGRSSGDDKTSLGFISAPVLSSLMKQKGWTVLQPKPDSQPARAVSTQAAPGQVPVYEFKKGDKIIITIPGGYEKTAADVLAVIEVGEDGKRLPEPKVRVHFADPHVPEQFRGENYTFSQTELSGLLARRGWHLKRPVNEGMKWVKVEPHRPEAAQARAVRLAAQVRELARAFDPQKRKQFALEDHLQGLLEERRALQSAYKEWLKSQEEGSVSVARRRAESLRRHDPLDTERYVNPEERGRWQRQFQRLDRQIKATEWAFENVEAGGKIDHNIPEDVLWDDPLVIRMAIEERNKRPITHEEDLRIEHQRMMREHKRGDWEGTLLAYASLQARYLAHMDGILQYPELNYTPPQGFPHMPGAPTLTALINSLIKDGSLQTHLPMVVTSGDLAAILPEIEPFVSRAKPDGTRYSRQLPDVREVYAEIERLRALEAQNSRLFGELREAEKLAHRILSDHRDSPEVAKLKGILEVADDPNTWKMVLAGWASGYVASLAEIQAVAAGLNLKKLNALKPLLHGLAFHATYNLTQHATLAHGQADWSVGGFAHAVGVMWWLGKVQRFYGGKVVPQYAEFLARRPAVLRTLNFIGSKTAEVAGLATFDLAIATAQHGTGYLTAENIRGHVISSAQFVIAYGALNAGRSHGGKSPEQRGYELAKARFEKDGSPEARGKMLEAQKTYLAHEIEQLRMAQGMQPDKREGLEVAERFRRVELAKIEIVQEIEKLEKAKAAQPAERENLERTQQLLRDQLALLVEVEKVYLEAFAQAQPKAEGETAGETGKPETTPRPEAREPPKTRLPRDAKIEELPRVEGEQGLEALVARIEAGKVYRLPSVDAQGRGETNYAFKDRTGNVYIIPAWAVAKTLSHQARGSKITVPVATILEMIAEGVAAQSVEGRGRYELHLKDSKGRVIGLDSVVTEQEIETNRLRGERTTVERDLDNVEHFVVDDAVLADRAVYGSPELHAIFLDGNPEYAREVAESLRGHGIDPASWSPQGSHKGKVRVLITAFPGKYMPPRHVADAWKGHRTLMARSEYEAWKAGRNKLDEAGILKPVMAVRDKAMAGDVEGLRKMFATGGFAEFPEAYRAKIEKAIDDLEAVLKKEGATPREILMAKAKVAEITEAALIRLKGIPIDEVKAGLVMPTDTPKEFKELAPVANAPSFVPQTGAPERSSRGCYGVRVNLGPQQLAPLMATVQGAEARPLHTTPTEELHVTFLQAPEIKALIDKEPAEPGLSKTKATEKAKARVKEKLAAAFGSLKGKPLITGIGKATDEHGNTVYFATVEWPEAQVARRELGLPEKDLHITLASTGVNEGGLPIDVHGVPKKANVATLENPLVTIRKELAAYGEQHRLRGLEGRIQRGLDPAGMLAVGETRAKAEKIAAALGVSMAEVVALTNELHVGGIWKNAPRLAEGKDPVVIVWMILGEVTNAGKEVEGDLTESQFRADYERVNRLLDEAVRDPKAFAERAQKSLMESSGKQFRMDGDVPVSDLDSGFLPIAIHGHRSGIHRDADGFLFVGADKLDYGVLEKMGLRAEQREDRGRTATFYVDADGNPVVKKIYDGFAIVLSKDMEVAKTLARTAVHEGAPSYDAVLEELGRDRELMADLRYRLQNPRALATLGRIARLLRPQRGERLLTLQEIDRLEEAALTPASTDRGIIYGFDPSRGPGAYQAIPLEQTVALADYVRLLRKQAKKEGKPFKVAEVACGDGRLAAHLEELLKDDGIKVEAVDNGRLQIAEDAHVQRRDGVEAAKDADVIIVSWPPKGPNTAEEALDYKLAKLIAEHPGKTLILLNVSDDTMTPLFREQVLGERTDRSRKDDPEITIPLQQDLPPGLNQIIGADGQVYILGRSRRKRPVMHGDGSYVFVFHSPDGARLPSFESRRLTDYSPPSIYRWEVHFDPLKSVYHGDPPEPVAKPRPIAGQSPNARMADAAVEKARLIADELGDPALLAEATALRERVKGASPGDEKGLQRELGALIKKIGPKCDEARKAQKAREKDSENFAANLTDVARLAVLEKEGILTTDDKEQLARALTKFPQLAGEISARIQSAVGSVEAALREGDQKKMIAANNSLQGLLFELSRYEAKRNGGSATPSIPQKQPLKVSYEGVRYRQVTRDGQTVVIEEAVTRTEAEVQEDVPIIEGHIWEVASYSRRNLGTAQEGDSFKRNQALKYEAAVKAGLVKGATIEVRGNIDPAFLTFLNQRCPNVEVLYSFILPGGREIVFPIRRAANGATIRPIDPPKDLTAAEAKVVKGIQRAIELGVLGEHLANDLLSAEQLAKSPLAQELGEAIDPSTGRVDPLKLKTLAAYHEYQRLMAERRWEIFSGLADKPNTHRPVDHLLQPMTETEIDREFERLRAHFNNHPMIPTRRQYTVTDEEATKVRAEFGKRLRAISEFESSRLSSPDTAADQARQRLGYRGNRHGYPLDPEHIYQDVVKGVRPPPKLSAKQQKAGAGRWASRSYDMTDQFPTAGQVASEMQGGRFQEEKTVVEVRYPAGAKQGDPDMPVTRSIDISGESADPTQRASEIEKNRRGLVQQTLDENFDRFQEMNEAATAPDHLLISARDLATSPQAAALKKALDPKTGRVNPEKITDPAVRAEFDRLVVQKRASVPETVRKTLAHRTNRPRIERAYAEYKSLYDAMVAEVRDPANKDKQAIRAKHQPGIEAAKIKLLATYREALGQEGYNEYAIRLLEERTDNVRKFIYALDANGEMFLFEEAMEAGSERPTHSMLAGGRNVYAAGELYIRVRGSEKPQVVVINNGSGHYRPDAVENLDYVKNILAQNGFDVGDTQLQHQRFPFVDLQDRPLEDLWEAHDPVASPPSDKPNQVGDKEITPPQSVGTPKPVVVRDGEGDVDQGRDPEAGSADPLWFLSLAVEALVRMARVVRDNRTTSSDLTRFLVRGKRSEALDRRLALSRELSKLGNAVRTGNEAEANAALGLLSRLAEEGSMEAIYELEGLSNRYDVVRKTNIDEPRRVRVLGILETLSLQELGKIDPPNKDEVTLARRLALRNKNALGLLGRWAANGSDLAVFDLERLAKEGLMQAMGELKKAAEKNGYILERFFQERGTLKMGDLNGRRLWTFAEDFDYARMIPHIRSGEFVRVFSVTHFPAAASHLLAPHLTTMPVDRLVARASRGDKAARDDLSMLSHVYENKAATKAIQDLEITPLAEGDRWDLAALAKWRRLVKGENRGALADAANPSMGEEGALAPVGALVERFKANRADTATLILLLDLTVAGNAKAFLAVFERADTDPYVEGFLKAMPIERTVQLLESDSPEVVAGALGIIAGLHRIGHEEAAQAYQNLNARKWAPRIQGGDHRFVVALEVLARLGHPSVRHLFATVDPSSLAGVVRVDQPTADPPAKATYRRITQEIPSAENLEALETLAVYENQRAGDLLILLMRDARGNAELKKRFLALPFEDILSSPDGGGRGLLMELAALGHQGARNRLLNNNPILVN